MHPQCLTISHRNPSISPVKSMQRKNPSMSHDYPNTIHEYPPSSDIMNWSIDIHDYPWITCLCIYIYVCVCVHLFIYVFIYLSFFVVHLFVCWTYLMDGSHINNINMYGFYNQSTKILLSTHTFLDHTSPPKRDRDYRDVRALSCGRSLVWKCLEHHSTAAPPFWRNAKNISQALFSEKKAGISWDSMDQKYDVIGISWKSSEDFMDFVGIPWGFHGRMECGIEWDEHQKPWTGHDSPVGWGKPVRDVSAVQNPPITQL